MRGRPKTGIKKYIRSFAISKDLLPELDSLPNRSWTVNKALKNYFKRKKRW